MSGIIVAAVGAGAAIGRVTPHMNGGMHDDLKALREILKGQGETDRLYAVNKADQTAATIKAGRPVHLATDQRTGRRARQADRGGRGGTS